MLSSSDVKTDRTRILLVLVMNLNEIMTLCPAFLEIN